MCVRLGALWHGKCVRAGLEIIRAAKTALFAHLVKKYAFFYM